MHDENKYYTVSAITNYISYKISTDVALKLVYIKGEMSNVRYSKGHLYFVLKDTEAEISSIIFANVASKLKFSPKDGMKVLITGSITPYSKRGTYNLIVNEIIEFGEGYLYQKFLESKDRLEKLGLFSPEHKKQIPAFSKNIGVITSSTGDAINDILSTINKRFPLVTVYVYPALVQGPDAPKSLIKALNKVEKDNLVDVVIIARGGGSFEDLNCFNDENLAKTIYDFSLPIVSGVGHENDYTICDFVCDDRAPTPTGAAVKVTPDKFSLFEQLDTKKQKISILINQKINLYTQQLMFLNNNYYLKNFNNVILSFETKHKELLNKLELNSPLTKINNSYDNVMNIISRIKAYNIVNKINELEKQINQNESNIYKCMNNYLDKLNSNFYNSLDKLILVNPLNIMKKGYAVVYKDKNVISSSKDINEDDILDVHFYDGNKKVKVI